MARSGTSLLLVAVSVSCGYDFDAPFERTGLGEGSDAGIADGSKGGAGGSMDGCVAQTCEDLDAECGEVVDRCGNVLSCGTCPGTEICGGGGPNRCGTDACVPATCALLGAECGIVADGCGDQLSCGDCSAPDTCGGGGQPNQCGCNPTTCAAQGAECGSIPNGCGETISCGSCSGSETCGGGGTANICGCTPATCLDLNADCGMPDDGCGQTLNCGTCTDPEKCGGGGDFRCGMGRVAFCGRSAPSAVRSALENLGYYVESTSLSSADLGLYHVAIVQGFNCMSASFSELADWVDVGGGLMSLVIGGGLDDECSGDNSLQALFGFGYDCGPNAWGPITTLAVHPLNEGLTPAAIDFVNGTAVTDSGAGSTEIATAGSVSVGRADDIGQGRVYIFGDEHVYGGAPTTFWTNAVQWLAKQGP